MELTGHLHAPQKSNGLVNLHAILIWRRCHDIDEYIQKIYRIFWVQIKWLTNYFQKLNPVTDFGPHLPMTHWLEWRKTKEVKSGCRVESGWGGIVGPVEYRLVVLPPRGAGGERCSVSPASRGALHSRNHVPQPFGWDTRFKLPTWNGQARVSNPSGSYLFNQANLQPQSCPHSSHKPTLPGPAFQLTKLKPI